MIKKAVIIFTVAVTIGFGIMGLIWGQLVTSILAFFVNTHYSGKFLNYNAWEQAKTILPLITLAFLAGAIAWIADYWMKKNGFWDISRLLAGATVGSAVYTGISALLKLENCNISGELF